MYYIENSFIRLRRNRRYDWLRDLVAETNITVADLILPLFVTEGISLQHEIPNMPNIKILSPDLILEQAYAAVDSGIKAIALFPRVMHDLKDEGGSEACNANNLICRTIELLKKDGKLQNLGIITDVALDPYTMHGHDGVLTNDATDVDNDRTVEILCQQAVQLAAAGANVVAPSDMMDGRVQAIRQSLDNNKHYNTVILSYAAKYASNFYGPFRHAVASNLSIGPKSKKTYQMDYRNAKEAIAALQIAVDEGADMVMVKPAMNYLDIINQSKNILSVPILGYQTSGEYSMIKYASINNCMNFDAAILESIYCIKRAGASAIFTYAALHIANILQK